MICGSVKQTVVFVEMPREVKTLDDLDALHRSGHFDHHVGLSAVIPRPRAHICSVSVKRRGSNCPEATEAALGRLDRAGTTERRPDDLLVRQPG